MAEKILYYMGAGASAYALPLARTLWGPDNELVPVIPQIPGIAYNLNNIDLDRVFSGLNEPKYQDYKLILKKNFSEISQKAEEFGDVDTYAKYLYLKDSDDFAKVKLVLSQYFSLEQLILGKKDSRYLPWLIGIMENNTFPENVKILNWNYDFQVELSAFNFGELENVNHRGNGFTYSSSFIKHYPSLDPTPNDNESFSIIHLNGIAGFSRPKGFQNSSIFQGLAKKSNIEIINYIINENHEPLIHFAWEYSSYHRLLKYRVAQMIESTSILVVIGYSFPFYNREIDKTIFNNLKSSGTLKKIYYQDPFLDGEQLRAQFSLNSDLQIVHIKNVDSFHIPFEY
jgi:hypothetical protein